MHSLRENPLMVEYRRTVTHREVEDYNEEDHDCGKKGQYPLYLSMQHRNGDERAGQRIQCVVWNANLDDSAIIRHSILVDRSRLGDPSNIGIQVGAGSVVEYCNFSVTVRDSDTSAVSIGKNCVVSGYTLQPEESVVLPDSLTLQRVSLSPPTSGSGASRRDSSLTSSMLFFEDDDCLLVYKDEDIVNNSNTTTIMGQSVQEFLLRTGLGPQDIWDNNSDAEADQTFRTARLFPIVDRKETFECYYAWLKPFCQCKSRWTFQQMDSLKRWKSAVRLTMMELEESCRAAVRSSIRASRRALLCNVLPAVKLSLYMEVLQTSLLVLPLCWSETTVSLVVNNYQSTLAWIQEQERRSEHAKRHTASRRRMAVKKDVVTPLRLLDDLIGITEDETVIRMAVHHQVSILRSLAFQAVADMTTTNNDKNDIMNIENHGRIARRVQTMISSLTSDRDRFTAVRDFLLLEYYECPDTFLILAKATEGLHLQSKPQLLLGAEQEMKPAQRPLPPFCTLPVANDTQPPQDCSSTKLPQDEMSSFNEFVAKIASVVLSSSDNSKQNNGLRTVFPSLQRHNADDCTVASPLYTVGGISKKDTMPNIPAIDSSFRNVDNLISLAAGGLLWKI